MEVLLLGYGAMILRVSRMRSIALFLPVMCFLSANAQTTALPFQWQDQTLWVDFEQTNLAASVRQTIRDDIAHSMSLIPVTNVTFAVLTTGDQFYGRYTGAATISDKTPINYCHGIFDYYTTMAGTNYFQIDVRACSNYLAAISLTNQYASAISSFSNFLNQVRTGFSVTNMTLAQKRALFWNPTILNYWEQQSETNFEQALTAAIPSAPTPVVTSPLPSILAYSVHDDIIEGGNTPLLCCEFKSWREGDWARKVVFVYVDGSWRFCLP
ncbi:MAG: hypothetical protein WCK89_13185 [bacterium]